jgi:hypothetical protein
MLSKSGKLTDKGHTMLLAKPSTDHLAINGNTMDEKDCLDRI